MQGQVVDGFSARYVRHLYVMDPLIMLINFWFTHAHSFNLSTAMGLSGTAFVLIWILSKRVEELSVSQIQYFRDFGPYK